MAASRPAGSSRSFTFYSLILFFFPRLLFIYLVTINRKHSPERAAPARRRGIFTVMTDTLVCLAPEQLTVLQPRQLAARMLTEDSSACAAPRHYSLSVHYAVASGRQLSSSVSGLVASLDSYLWTVVTYQYHGTLFPKWQTPKSQIRNR